MGRATRVNGYEVEEAPNGAWWVRLPGGAQAWRFATKLAAVRFAQRLPAGSGRPPAAPGCVPAPGGGLTAGGGGGCPPPPAAWGGGARVAVS